MNTPTPQAAHIQVLQPNKARIVNPSASVVLGTDAHLPAVTAQHLMQAAIKSALDNAAQVAPATLGDGHRFQDRALRPAAVLVPLIQRDSGVNVVLTQRSSQLRDHAGQIAFAGGRIDATDASAWHAACREAHEEIALATSALTALGQLSTYTTVTAFEVTPCVAWLLPTATFYPFEAEVAAVFEVPLAFLMNPANHQRRTITTPAGERTFYAIPYLDNAAHEWFIWGATAGMIRNLYTVLSAYQQNQQGQT